MDFGFKCDIIPYPLISKHKLRKLKIYSQKIKKMCVDKLGNFKVHN